MLYKVLVAFSWQTNKKFLGTAVVFVIVPQNNLDTLLFGLTTVRCLKINKLTLGF